jgi:hypothetical protein
MNNIMQLFLHRFVLVFFDDILIFSSSWSEHLWHVHLVISKLHAHQLFVRITKCDFGSVAMDEQKIMAVLEWPQP